MCQPIGATTASARDVVVSVEAISQKLLLHLLELLLLFLAKFPLLENYMFSPYIILVSNGLVD